MPPISNSDLQKYYASNFIAGPRWETWLEEYEDYLREVAAWSDSEFRTEASQRRLWSARGIGGVGPGESVTVEGAYTDPEIIDLLWKLRLDDWPKDPRERGLALEEHFQRVLRLVTERHSDRKPIARLTRLFLALRPSDFHCVYSVDEANLQKLFGLPRSEPRLVRHVLIRERLRSALGPEQNLNEQARRGIFCWWLQSHAEELQSGSELPSSSSDLTPTEKSESTLKLLPWNMQWKGFPAIRGYTRTYRDIVRHAMPGVTTSEIVALMAADEDNAGLKLSSLKAIIGYAKSVGLLESDGDQVRPTVQGIQFLENDDPDALVELMLVRKFPFAWILRILTERELPTSELYDRLIALHPGWTSNFAPSAARSWCRDLGLVEIDGKGICRLTEYGKQWHARLPADLPAPSKREQRIEQEEESDDPLVALSSITQFEATVSFDQLWTAFSDLPESKEMVVNRMQLLSLHSAWHCSDRKRFVLFSGLSGSGKTSIAVLYAKAYARVLGLPGEKHYSLVPVSPDWRDPSGLLGYYSRLHEDPTYELTPAARLLIDAARNPHLPYFLILDEMNLARVERYFAPLLSSMESGEPIELYSNEDEITGIPTRVKWPKNLFIAGTVNMDETTHPFSDKVLDRAFTLEFWDVDLKALFKKKGDIDTETVQALLTFHDFLKPVRRHFGYRTANEVLAFVETAKNVAGIEKAQIIDQALFSKVLPRLRGEQSEALRVAINGACDFCLKNGYPRSAEKLASMIQQLNDTGLTRFWA